MFARDDKTGKTVIGKVDHVTVRKVDHTIDVALADASGRVVETLQTTRNHPFYVDGKGWVPAGALGIGNAIVTRAGPTLVVKSVKWNRRVEGFTVYNFEVEALSGKAKDGENTHSYFVGNAAGGAWVHNARYTANSQAHIWAENHDPGSQLVPGKTRFFPGEGGQNFTDEVINTPGIRPYTQPDGRLVYRVRNMGRFVGEDAFGNRRITGGRVVVEGPNPPSGSPHAPGDVVTQFPDDW